jgi:Guanylate-kinase-associated protein (GKAP) protein
MMNSLPVMKHLRPEFAKQLQFMNSPKKSLTRTSTGNFLLKSEHVTSATKTDQPQNGTSGSTSTVVTSNPLPPSISKNNTIQIDLSNSEFVSKDREISMDRVVHEAKQVIESETVNNNCVVSKKISSENLNGNSKMEPAHMESKDGHYFLRLLHTEKTRILKLAQDLEDELFQLQSDVSHHLQFLFVYDR